MKRRKKRDGGGAGGGGGGGGGERRWREVGREGEKGGLGFQIETLYVF